MELFQNFILKIMYMFLKLVLQIRVKENVHR